MHSEYNCKQKTVMNAIGLLFSQLPLISSSAAHCESWKNDLKLKFALAAVYARVPLTNVKYENCNLYNVYHGIIFGKHEVT